MASPVIDWDQLDMIADGFSPDFLEIYREFLAEVPSLLGNLKNKITAGDAVSAAKIAHQIKGSCANFGFIGVSRPVANIELEAKGGSLANAATFLAQAEEGFRAAEAEVKAQRGV